MYFETLHTQLLRPICSPGTLLVLAMLLANGIMNGQQLDMRWSKHVIDNSLPSATSVDVADLDGDGDLDIAATAWSANAVVWYENRGNCSNWVKHYIRSNVPIVIGVSIADLNNDGKPDIAVTAFGSQEVLWFENALPNTNWAMHPVGYNTPDVNGLASGDLNGDGLCDIVTAIRSQGDLIWFRNQGGTPRAFQRIAIDPTLGGPRQKRVIDINRDGHLDVVAVGDKGAVRWYENDGTSLVRWTQRDIDSTLNGAVGLGVGDVEGDGDLDVAVTSISLRSLVLFRNDGSDTAVWTPDTIDTMLSYPLAVRIADLDRDGRGDIIATDSLKHLLAWYDSNESFQRHVIDNALAGARNVRAVDLDQDGRIDIVAMGQTGGVVAWYRNEIVAPRISAHPMVIDFGKVLVNDSCTRTLLLSNEGVDSLLVYKPRIGGTHKDEFRCATQQPFTLAPNGSTTLTLTCAPEFDSIKSGLLYLDSNDPDTQTLTVELRANAITSAITNAPLPGKLRLEQNYPNPFNPATRIAYLLPSVGRTRLVVYDVFGREIGTLVDEVSQGGRQLVHFDADGLPSGVYVYRLYWNGHVRSRKMSLLR